MSDFSKNIVSDLHRLSQSSGKLIWLNLIHPRFVPIILIRLARLCYISGLLRPVSAVLTQLNLILFGLEVTPRCSIGPGLLLPHTSGTVIGAAEIGSNVTIFQGVTLGAKYADLDFTFDSRPILEDDVVIGSGAKVLGGIRIGKRVVVASNSLLTESVPDDGYAIGVPAIVKARD